MSVIVDIKKVTCPFGCGEKQRGIVCEGTKDYNIQLTFNARRDKELQQKIFCTKKYQYCEIYRMLEKNKKKSCNETGF